MPLKILFVLHVLSQARHFASLYEELSRRGHDVLLLVEHVGRKPPCLPEYLRHIDGLRIDKLVYPNGIWARYSRAFRATRNYLLYYHRSFEKSAFFRDRAYGWTDPFLRRWLPRSTSAGQTFRRFLERVEDAIPPSSRLCKFLSGNKFDLVLVSPYIFHQNMFQNDYIKCAHHLGIPTGFPVFSWDNLTSKGKVQILPDRIWVWNDTQLRELTDLHGVPADRVGVMGAWRFEEFRKLQPSSDREHFCRNFGLDPAAPLIAYLGSSPVIAPDEGSFVLRWLEGLRACADPLVANANVIVRAHPRNLDGWRAVDRIRSDERVTIQEPAATSFWDSQNLYDLLAHCHAVVGLNTSAMLEAAILRRPVHTVRDPSVESGQEGTVHFGYLTTAGGGLLYVANDHGEHHRLLSDSLRQPPARRDPKAEAFFRAFIDDGKDARSPTLRLADDMIALTRLSKQPTRRRILERLLNVGLSTAIVARVLPVQREVSMATAAGRRIMSAAQRAGAPVAAWLQRRDPTRVLEAYIVAAMCHDLGYQRPEPPSIEGLPLGTRALGRMARALIRAGIAMTALLGARRNIADMLGPILVQYAGKLPVKTFGHCSRPPQT